MFLTLCQLYETAVHGLLQVLICTDTNPIYAKSRLHDHLIHCAHIYVRSAATDLYHYQSSHTTSACYTIIKYAVHMHKINRYWSADDIKP